MNNKEASKNSFNCFKFRVVNECLIDSLHSSTLYFASREALNDPFDSNIDVETILKKFAVDPKNKLNRKIGKEILKNRAFFQKFHRNIAKLGICSFSIALHQTLMWAHYGNAHRGVALEYDFPLEYLNDEDKFLGISAITYDNDAISAWLNNHLRLYESDHYEFVTGLFKVMLTSKSPSWSYEEEGRIIRPTTGSLEIPRKMLKSVTFGLRISDKDETALRDAIDSNYSGIQYRRVVRGDSDFGLKFIAV